VKGAASLAPYEEKHDKVTGKQTPELHEVMERHLLSPDKEAMLLDDGSLVLMASDTGTQMVLDAVAGYVLLDLLYNHKAFLHRSGHQQEKGSEQQEFVLGWHPAERDTARLAYGNDTPLWGSERLEVWHEGRWIAGKAGNKGAASGMMLWPTEVAGNPEYITLSVGSRVRNVSEPQGDRPEQ
jgi:hypothetical protein